ncbi:MAG: glycosyltransferase family 2 protein [Acidimicrobiia bacterium]
METTPAITVAIPYYAARSYLAEAIDSVLGQSLQDWRLLIVDDAGPEPAADLVASYADDRIEHVRNPVNLGLAGNWNECIRRASTDLVTLLHGDDRLAPGYVAAVVAAAIDHPDVAAVFTDPVVIGEDGRPARSLPDAVKRLARRPRTDHVVDGDRDLASILANNYVFCPTLCFRRSVVGERPFDERWKMVIDLDLVARLLLRGERLAAVRSPLYEYRRHGGNQTNVLTSSAVRFEEELALYRELAVVAAGQGWQRTARAARRRSMVRTHLALRAGLDLAARRVPAARAKTRLLVNDLRSRRPA